jgi:sucrose-6-phosphate hydrolase SacC (GH32 family)
VLEAITHYNRDPKVFWHEPTKQWIMAITLSCANHWLDGDYRFALLTSPDLKQWTEARRFEMPRGLDCPDMFELSVDGDPKNTRWVFWAGDGTHAVGTFDGKTFTCEGEIRLPLLTWEQDGANGYAAQTFSDIPSSDGRRIQISWLRHGSYPGMPFNQQASFPCELTLCTTPECIQLFRRPIREIELLRKSSRRWQDEPLTCGGKAIGGAAGELLDISAEMEFGDLATVTLEVRGIPIVYEARAKTLRCLGAAVALAPVGNRVRLQVLVDRTSLEVFANDGRVNMSFGCHPQVNDRAVLVSAMGGVGRLVDLTVHELRSIWAEDEKRTEEATTLSLAKTPFIFGVGGIGDAMPFYHEGHWHVFHMQSEPVSIGHRVSRDLVNWEVRPIAIPGPMATGSVIEHKGTFYFFYTGPGQTVYLATSEDLDHWTIHENNPLVTADGKQYVGPDFRDPYVFRNEAEDCWWMLICTRVPGRHRMRSGCIGVYKSKDLLNWEAAEPLCAPETNSHHECPQVMRPSTCAPRRIAPLDVRPSTLIVGNSLWRNVLGEIDTRQQRLGAGFGGYFGRVRKTTVR